MIDRSKIRQIVEDLGAETAVEFLTLLPGEITPLVAQIADAVAAGDAALLSEARHTLKGVTGSMGLTALQAAAEATRTVGIAAPAMADHLARIRQAAADAVADAEKLKAELTA